MSQIIPKISTTFPGTSISEGFRWKRIEKEIADDLREKGIELLPRKLPEIFAKIHTGESLKGKGICLMGNCGTGKSRRLRWMSEAFGISFISSIELVDGYHAEGTDCCELLRLSPCRWSEVPRHFNDLIIDDLGSETEELVRFGTHYNVLAEVIEHRYNRFPDWKTHFSTNLTITEIKSRYGERIFSRLNEMCVFINLSGKDRRLEA